MKLAVVAPVYNEEEGIAFFHERIKAILDTLSDVDAEIVLVVDRSNDRTLDILRDIAMQDPKTRVLALSSRFGHQASLMAGIANAREADCIIMMDSDLQHPPELIPDMLKKFCEGFDVVFTVRQDNEDAKHLRKSAGELFYALLNKISSIEIHANAADFRLISRRIANILVHDIRERNLFLRGIISWVGFAQIGLGYKAEARSKGTSKYSLQQMLRLALAGVLSFSTKPLQIGIYLGLAFSVLSFVYAFVLVLYYFLSNIVPSGWTSISVLILLATGVQLIVTGVVGLYVGGIFEEVKARPLYIIQDEIKISSNHARV